jgi:hypothetical protein
LIKRLRRVQSFLPLPYVLRVTVVQIIKTNDISWMLIRGSPRRKLFFPWVILLSERGGGPLFLWRIAGNWLNTGNYKPIFWRCLEEENVLLLFSKYYNDNNKTKNITTTTAITFISHLSSIIITMVTTMVTRIQQPPPWKKLPCVRHRLWQFSSTVLFK